MNEPLSEAQQLRIARALRRATNDSPAGIRRSNLGEVYHSPDLDAVELQELAAIVGGSALSWAIAIRGWFMVFPPEGATKPHVHAEADLVTVTGVYGEGAIRVAGERVLVKQGKTIAMYGNEKHEALPGEFKRASLVINWKRR